MMLSFLGCETSGDSMEKYKADNGDIYPPHVKNLKEV